MTIQNGIFQGGTFPETPMLCEGRLSPIVMAGIMLEVTKQLYSDPEFFISPLIKPWTPADTEGSTYITDSGDWRDNQVSRRPLIAIDIGDFVYDSDANQGLESRLHYDLTSGVSTFSRRVTGSIVWMHAAETHGQARLYSTNTLDLLDGFGPVIQRDFGFEKLQTRGIFRPTQTKDAPREWHARVQLDFQLQETFRIGIESPKLKQITFNTDFLNQDFNQVS
jgi:hypothetical protein